MYVHSVKFINFKSIGDYAESEIILEPRVTAIIGKNESGKSNVLDGLSRIDFSKKNLKAFMEDDVNRNCETGAENRYVITLKPNSESFAEGIETDTVAEFSKTQCIITGGFLDYCKRNVWPISESFVEFLDELGGNPMQARDQELTNFKSYREELLEKENCDVYRKTAALDFFRAKANKIPNEHRDEFVKRLEDVYEAWKTAVSMFPTVFYRRKDKRLGSSYKLEDVEKELGAAASTTNSLLPDFVKLIGVSSQDFITATKTGSSPPQISLRKKINRKTNERINIPFRDFYKTEDVALELDFNAGRVSFVVQSGDGASLVLSERSDGLRWYLETYIDAQANDISERNVVYLFDEPGISLHVNAQRELINLFHHLSEKGNQVVYTTHSPYMLDLQADGLHRIRAVAKNMDGFTYIYKSAYDSRIFPDSQKDTLTPIINAIGMTLNDTFGPAKDKLNIVIEGMSDYIYLSMMSKVLDLDMGSYVLLPSVGASNCINICSILHGWGCRYIAVFDYDAEGVTNGGELMREKMASEYGRQYCYLADVLQEDVNRASYRDCPCEIEDIVTRDELDRFCSETDVSADVGKVLKAKLMCNAVEAGDYMVGEKCKSNFEALFKRIFSCFEQ